MWRIGLSALRHVGSSQTRDRTHVSCIGRQILYHWSSRVVSGGSSPITVSSECMTPWEVLSPWLWASERLLADCGSHLARVRGRELYTSCQRVQSTSHRVSTPSATIPALPPRTEQAVGVVSRLCGWWARVPLQSSAAGNWIPLTTVKLGQAPQQH